MNKEDIPFGDYCYTWIEVPSEFNNFRGKVKNCPFYSSKEINGVKIPWCLFLNQGGEDNRWTDEDHKKLLDIYGTDEKISDEFPLFLLWDGVKECGQNSPDE